MEVLLVEMSDEIIQLIGAIVPPEEDVILKTQSVGGLKRKQG